MHPLSIFNTHDYLTLNHRQKLAFNAAYAGDNMFIIGGGGVGKSHLTRVILRHIPGIVALGSTGTASVNVGGQTVDSYFGFGRFFKRPEDAKKLHAHIRERLKSTRSILIDEFGALRRDKLVLIDLCLREAKGVALPFGGVQLIAVGDYCQIKPVLTSKGGELALFREYYGKEDVYPFLNQEYESYALMPHLLTEYLRQPDEEEQRILKSIRLGKNVDKALAVLHSKLRKEPHKDAISLCCLKSVADRYNVRKFGELIKPSVVFHATQEGEVELPPVPGEIHIKEGLRVVLTVNKIEDGYSNGDIGTVLSISKESVSIELDRGPIVNVEPFEWVFFSQNVGVDGKISKRTIGSYTQLPIMMAYGITIHRSQGMTLPSVHIDLSGGFFSEGMPYVGLSRAVSLRCLSLSRRLLPSDIKVNKLAVSMTEKLSLEALARTRQDEERFKIFG